MTKLWKLILLGYKTGINQVFTSKEQGSGKNLMFEYFGKKILGEPYFAYFSCLEDLTSKFSSLRCCKSLVLGDELDTWASDHKTAKKLKSMITSTVTKLERKGCDAINLPDYANYCLLSNIEYIAKVEGSGDRRQLVHIVSGHKKVITNTSIGSVLLWGLI